MENSNKSSFFYKIIKLINETNKFLLLIILFAVLVGLFFIYNGFKEAFTPKPIERVNTSTLESIIDISELSTFVAVYNGVAVKYDDSNTEKIDYYVYYEARVKVGIDFQAVTFENNVDEKKILVTLPPLTLTETVVDISTLDFMFIDSKSETNTVIEEAYELCHEDLAIEVSHESSIYELGGQNAINTIEALVSHFVDDFGEDYTLEVSFGEVAYE